MRYALATLLLAWAAATGGVWAQDAGGGAAAAPLVDLETLVVAGEQPGPGLWQVRRGEHVLWVLGTVEPLPRRMRWMSARVEGLVARSQELIEPPSFKVDADVGLLRGLTLVPALLRARRNPGGRTLAEVLPPETHARWEPLKARYLGDGDGVERWRPIFAAQALYEAAIRRSGMTLDDSVGRVLARAARRHRVRRTPTQVELRVDAPRQALRELAAVDLDDGACFERTLQRIETDLEGMRARANAWALGDVAYLQRARYDDQYRACLRAVTSHALGRRLGLDELNARAIEAWLQAAEAALAANASTVSSLPMSLLLGERGMLERLRARGYEIVPPADAMHATGAGGDGRGPGGDPR
ncbi:TraB/GumN family protein [Luteimonas huabeiensis]|uniref:TraB/GumN family protein n=1 Tax=Luteimonas huabeiensis TaxID=1244513 RepID=UPI0004675A75|nr:TraB/GumN family protein [Luteimonas huabeiensis]